MKTLKEFITDAAVNKIAVGHFNISDSEGFKAVVDSANELNLPVIIGVSEGERDFIGVEEIKALVDAEKKKGLPIFLNADHTYSFEKVKEAIDNGFDSVIIDGAKLEYAENVQLVQECVAYARKTNPQILIEAELGYIGQSSKILDTIPEGVSEETQTKPEDAKKFVEETGIDMLAPSVGNIHGIVKTGEPRLNIELIKNIYDSVKIPLVLHGASGNSDEDIRAAIEVGIRIVHINTEMRVAYKEGVKEGVAGEEVAPYKFMEKGYEEMKKVILSKLRLFNNIDA